MCLTLNGIVPQTIDGEYSGDVWIKGRKAIETPVYELSQDVGLVFQDAESQFAALTTYDELSFAPENLNLPEDEVRRRVDDAIETANIAQIMGKNTFELSGGEKQRLALAAVLTLEPEILVFDEITANLDPVGTSMVFETLRKLRNRGDKTILIVEHKVDEVVELVDRVIVFDERSRVVASGPPREVFYEADQALMKRLGIWIPEVVELVLRLEQAGFSELAAKRVLTPQEAASVLHESENLSAVSDGLSEGPENTVSGEDPLAFDVENLSFSYLAQGQPALDDAHLTVPDGGFIAIVGPNGSGKTTLVKHLIGILTPPAGRVFMWDQDLSEMSTQEISRQVGFVFQNPEHQIVTESVYDELGYSLKKQRVAEDEIKRRVMEIAEVFRLEDRLNQNPYMLSGGEKRRMGVATMLIVGQEILILDEPTYGQDSQTAKHLMGMLQAQHARGRTIIMVTHDMKLVGEYARQVFVLWKGQTRFSGTPLELFEESDLLEQTSLIPPPMFRLSKLLQDSIPSFPVSATVDQLSRAILGERYEQI